MWYGVVVWYGVAQCGIIEKHVCTSEENGRRVRYGTGSTVGFVLQCDLDAEEGRELVARHEEELAGEVRECGLDWERVHVGIEPAMPQERRHIARDEEGNRYLRKGQEMSIFSYELGRCSFRVNGRGRWEMYAPL